jgi:exonuclease III
MIVGTFNIRGMGSRVKRRKIRDLVLSEKIDFLAVQETKMEVISEKLCHGLWGGDGYDWVFFPAVGNSRGLLSLWDKAKANRFFSFMGEGFLGVCLDLISEQRRCCFVNVYAKCNIQSKWKMWEEIVMSRRGFGGCLWCIVGDFNSVRDDNEHRGLAHAVPTTLMGEMREFDSFLLDIDLVDNPIIGRNFTWFHPNGVSMSRLDRVLLSFGWSDVWPNPNVRVLPRDVSDHCPLVLRYGEWDWGPKPFRFNNSWLQNKTFKDLVLREWGSQSHVGWMSFILQEKLKGLKGAIKGWKQETFGRPEEKKRELIAGILAIDEKSENGGLSVAEVEVRRRMFEELRGLLKSIDTMLFQRSRSKWIKEGDANTSFFHA